MTGVLCALAGIGGVLDTQTVTAGYLSGKGVDTYGFVSGSMGSISDGTFNPKGGATVLELYWLTDFSTNQQLFFTLSGAQTNDGWATMTIGSQTFTRASATFSSATDTEWLWTGVSTNPFPTNGANYVVTFA